MSRVEMIDVVSAGDFVTDERDVLSVLWAITKGCNYMCSYCPYSKDTRFSDFSSLEELLHAAETITRLGRPGYQVTLYGGEPTFHPHFLGLLSYLATSDVPIKLRMFTNGSRPYPFFTEMAKALDGAPFGVIFSCHPEFSKFENFKRCVQTSIEAGMSVAVNFVFISAVSDRSRSQIMELLELAKASPFFMEINFPYTVEGAMDVHCSLEDIEWVKRIRPAFEALPMPNGLASPNFVRTLSNITIVKKSKKVALAREKSLQFLSSLNTPSYRDFYCCSGTNVIFVEEHGDYRGGVCESSKVMGNLFRDSEITVIQSTGVIKCAAAACNSIENIPLPKFRDEDEAVRCTEEFRLRASRRYVAAESRRLGL